MHGWGDNFQVFSVVLAGGELCLELFRDAIISRSRKIKNC